MAKRVQEIAKKIGFDWKNKMDVFDKIEEELKELKMAIRKRKRREVKEEFGDFLFSVVNLARHIKVNPEEALQEATDKFWFRFQALRRKLRKKGRSVKLKEMDEIWEKIKQ